MTELTVDFDEEYSVGPQGSNKATPIAPWAVAIDGRRYLLDTKSGQYGREGIDVLQQRNTNNQRDTLLLPQDVWRHQTESWHLGAGQANLDRDDALQNRYFRSFGIDPWEKYELTLLNETEQIHDIPAGPDPSFVQVHKGNLVVIIGANTYWYDTPTHNVLLASGISSKAIAITYDGDSVIVLYDDGTVVSFSGPTTKATRTVTPPAGTTPAANPIGDASFIAYAKDYLIMGVGNQLWDITAAQAKLIYTSPVTGFTWKGAAEGNQAIYAVGGVGDKHVIHRLGVKQDGTGLQPAITAGTLPDGEIGVSIGSYLGYIFIGTDKGVRMASPVSNADLVLGALLPTLQPVYGFEGQDRFVWVTGSEINPVPSHGETRLFKGPSVCGLYRTDMSSFTVTELTPAYATDIVAPLESGKIVRSVTTWNSKRVFSVDGGGVYMESDTLMPAGWLENGRISFSVEDLKTSLYCQAKWEPLHGTVELYLSYDSAKPIRIMSWSIQESIRSGNISMDGQQFSRLDSRVDLIRDKTNDQRGPIFSRFEVRARAVKGAASRWSLPIINHEELDLNGVIEARDVTDEFFRLMALVESGKMFPLQEWGRTYYVVAKDFVWKPERLNLAGTGWQGVYTLIVEEVR